MRIIAGSRKGLTLAVPPGRAVRPTPGRVREAAMSVLGGALAGERVLDLCAGSGAIGLELLSRGAGAAVFVEPDPAALAALRQNLGRAAFAERARLIATDAARALATLRREGARFELVWLDPPWASALHGPLLRALVAAELLAPAAEVWVESPAGLPDDALAAVAGALLPHERRRYGDVTLDRLWRATEAT
jgi:16S rRNA (guanine(966)-N(2))-methyltransferase RsmD